MFKKFSVLVEVEVGKEPKFSIVDEKGEKITEGFSSIELRLYSHNNSVSVAVFL